jgi:predicted ATPase
VKRRSLLRSSGGGAFTSGEKNRSLAYTGKVLKQISLLRDRVTDWQRYPFSVPSIRSLEEIDIHSRVCFFIGENGSGKSTLLEAIAVHYGFGREGGTRNFYNDSTASNHSVDALVRALRLSFDRRTGAGFFLRAESLFNVASYIEQSDEDQEADPGIPLTSLYGEKSLHSRSHGEAFFTLFELKCQRDGLFLLDEPEAALSPQRQLAFLVLLNAALQNCSDAQFIVCTHSPILLGFPGAQIVCFDEGRIHPIAYQETAPFQIYRRFLNDSAGFLDRLFREEI